MTKEVMTVIILGLVAVLVLVIIVILLSQLTKERIGVLGNLRETIANNSTYITTAIAVGNELYNSYHYNTAINWTIILALLGISGNALKQGRAQEALKTNTQATENTAASVDLVLNTMPVGPKNPVAATRTQVKEDVTPVHPSSPSAKPAIVPGSIL